MRNRHILWGASLSLLLFTTPITEAADPLSNVKVSFKTLACDGARGLASVNADRIYKIQSMKCGNQDPVKEVFQVLVRAPAGEGMRYEAFTTSETEAEKIIAQVDAYQADKRKALTDTPRLIIDRNR